MAIEYDYFKNPPQEGSDEPLLHPRPVIKKTIDFDYLAKRISADTSFTGGDLAGVLKSLSDAIIDGLSDGCNVYLEGIGTFSVTLESRYVKDKSEIRSASIKVKGVSFRADKKLKNGMKKADIQRVRQVHKRKTYPEVERYERILWYISRYECINLTNVMRLNQCTYAKAKNDISYLLNKLEIKESGMGRYKVYVLRR